MTACTMSLTHSEMLKKKISLDAFTPGVLAIGFCVLGIILTFLSSNDPAGWDDVLVILFSTAITPLLFIKLMVWTFVRGNRLRIWFTEIIAIGLGVWIVWFLLIK